MHSSERDGEVTTVIPIGKGQNLFLFGKKNGEKFTFSAISYTVDSKLVFSHSDQSDDGIFDELEYREPPFAVMNLFTSDENGDYGSASNTRYQEVIKTQEIYADASKKAFSNATVGQDEFNKVYEEAHSKVREIQQEKKDNKANIATPRKPSD